jgi:hypothetical protein
MTGGGTAVDGGVVKMMIKRLIICSICFLPAAPVHAGMTSRSAEKSPYQMYLSAPSASLISNSKPLPRRNLTLMVSRDGGKSWTQQMVLDEEISSYSDLQFAGDGTLLCLYEAGEHYKSIKCLRITM